MTDLLPFVYAGIAAGAVYGMVAAGVVLTYKTSGIFNFGHGALATIAAIAFYWLYYDTSGPQVGWEIAAFLCVFVLGPAIGLAMELVSRRLARQSTAYKIVGTVGIVLLVQGLGQVLYGPDAIPIYRNFLPWGDDTFEVGGAFISGAQVTLFVTSLIAVALLYVMFRYSRRGLAMRAVVDDPDLVELQGTNTRSVQRVAWIIGATFAALAGVLLLPILGLDMILFTFLVVQAFGAAAIGGFSSIPLAFAGGLVIGVLSSVSQKYVIDYPTLNGVPASLPFIVLIVVLLVLPKRKLVAPSRVTVRPPLRWDAPGRIKAGTAVLVLIPLLLVPQLVGPNLPYFTKGMADVITLLALGLLVRTSGQISLATAAFVAIGATTFSHFMVDFGVPWLPSVLIAGLVAIPIGALVAIPAIRLSGLFLALATLAFGIMVQTLIYGTDLMFGSDSISLETPRPSFATSEHDYYYVVLGFAVVIGALVVIIHRTRLGRLLHGISDSPCALTTMGLSLNVTRVIVFCLYAFFAAISGVLYSSGLQFGTSTNPVFQPFASLVLLATLAIAPFAEPWYALFALIGAVTPAYISGSDVSFWLTASFGFFAIWIAMAGTAAPPAPQWLRDRLERLGRRKPKVRPAREAVPALATAAAAREPADLEVDGLTVRFGGLVAVDDISFRAPSGVITGLIGPNGAGKTTAFDACSGLNRPSAGRIRFGGHDVSRRSAAARARRGLGRTFQRAELCETLSVEQNVGLGLECGMAGGGVISQFVSRPHERRAVAASVEEALETCGIEDLAKIQAGALSTGERRLVELARCLAGNFQVLLLDEPSSGLDRGETRAFADILCNVVAERGCGILLVEHDMSLVLSVCSHIYVLDFGEMIFAGSPEEVTQSDIVKAAYLGDDVPVEVRPAGAT